MEENQHSPDTQPKRPQLLSILCIFTFIGSGMGVLGFFMVSVNYEATMEAMRIVYADMPEVSFLLAAPREFFFISFLLSGFSVAGALLMWKLRKAGFHFYTAAQLVFLVLPMIYFGKETNPIFNILTTAIFVYLYARNLKYMH
ncbi:MAG: hypothetical protein K8R63_09915 [Bacteroidales bacterium]|nr:hypothetical protein [Bacteroidales bacterium]